MEYYFHPDQIKLNKIEEKLNLIKNEFKTKFNKEVGKGDVKITQVGGNIPRAELINRKEYGNDTSDADSIETNNIGWSWETFSW